MPIGRRAVPFWSRYRSALAPWIFTIGFFLIWEASCRVFAVPRFILPAPSDTAIAIWQFQSQLLFHAWHTLWMTLVGFAIAIVVGLVLGIALGASRFIYDGAYPLLIGFNAIPKVALVPVLVLWFGLGWAPAVITAFLISFFPIVVNVAAGLATIEPELEDVLRALGAKRSDIIRKVGLPRAMPYFFASLKVAITLAYIGSVIAEFNSSRYGIGNLIARASDNIPLVFACLIVLAVMGVLMYLATVLAEKRFTGWAYRSGLAQS